MKDLQAEVTTVSLLELAARKYPDREFLICDQIRRKFKEVDERVNSLANALIDFGLERGDRVGSYLANCPEILENYMATNKVGALPVPLNFRLSPREIAWILNQAKVRVLFLGEEFLPIVQKIRPELPSVQYYIVAGNQAPEGFYLFEELIAKYPSRPPGVSVGPDDPAMLMYTAGTTGFPKGVLCRHRNNIWSLVNSILYDIVLGRSGSQETTAYPLPFFHKAAYITAVSQLMKFGRCVIMRSFDAVKLLELIQKERVNQFAMVPTVAHAILQVPDLEKYDLSSWNTVRCTGAPLPVALKDRFARTFPHVDICDNYGMTEIATIAMQVSRGKVVNPTTVGKPHPLTEVKIMDDHGRELPPGEIGEICVRSPALFREYFENPEANAEAFAGGWFHTADMGTFDEEGYLYIKDRKKDMIISGGENIYPAEVEQILFAHPQVLEASCLGIPDPQFGEAVMAALVLKPGASISEGEIIGYAAQHLGKFKVPKRVVFLDQLPKSAVGKVLRRELRKQFGGTAVKYE
ncbi:MAG: long-chain-fatty-acid--CoA ligase [Thermodesulfobacteriota bacterium]|nr:long-chain-fatty-acid--CoA ligase [Thermodesulfobacteriota bacterium]